MDDVTEEDEEKQNGEDDEGVTAVGMRPVGMNVGELSAVLHGVCTSPRPGKDKEEEEELVEGGPSALGRHPPSLYRPSMHDTEMIHSVFLRSASCPGVWDALKDPLWEALPLNVVRKSEESKDAGSAVATGGGDDVWLGRLAESVNSSGGLFSPGGGDTGSVRSLRSGGTERSRGEGTVGSVAATVGSGAKGGKGRSGAREKKKVGGKEGGKKAERKDVADFFSDLLKK